MPIFKKIPLTPNENELDTWARPEMLVTFRGEIMPGKDREARTFKIKNVLPNGRVILYGFPDEHRKGSFEPINFKRNIKSRD